jgi:DNA-binding response OmpR family regulator
MMRITVVESSAEKVRLRVEGRVTGPWVDELRRTCEVQALEDRIQLTLDLADLSFADAEGIELLRELRADGVILSHPASWVAQQLTSL